MIRRTAAGMLCFLMMMRRYCWRTGNETGLSWLRASPVYRLVINSEPTIAAGLCRAGGRCDCARIKSIPACVPKTRCVEKVRSASAPPPRDPSRSENSIDSGDGNRPRPEKPKRFLWSPRLRVFSLVSRRFFCTLGSVMDMIHCDADIQVVRHFLGGSRLTKRQWNFVYKWLSCALRALGEGHVGIAAYSFSQLGGAGCSGPLEPISQAGLNLFDKCRRGAAQLGQDVPFDTAEAEHMLAEWRAEVERSQVKPPTRATDF